MSYQEMKERRASNFRTGMDIGMGLFYVMVGVVIIYGRGLSTIPMPEFLMQIPAFIVYILGAMMVVGGGFRFYRGIKAVLPEKKNNDPASE